MKHRRPWELRTAKRTPLSGAPGRPSGVVSYANQNEASPSLGAANCETDATFGDSWEEWWHSQARIRPHRPLGLRIAKVSPLSWASGGPSGIVSYANQNEASPSLGAANCETAATFVGSWQVQRVGVICRPRRNFPVPGGCELRNCRWFRWLLGSPAECCHTQIRMRPRRPWGPRTANEASPSFGAANCEIVATFVGSRGAQRNGVIRRPE